MPSIRSPSEMSRYSASALSTLSKRRSRRTPVCTRSTRTGSRLWRSLPTDFHSGCALKPFEEGGQAGLVMHSKTERVASGVRVDLVVLVPLEVVGRFQQPCTERDR